MSGTILAVESNEVVLEVAPSGLQALLSRSHLTDFESHEAPLFSILKAGMRIPELVVISRDAHRGRVQVSRKPLLIHAARQAAAHGGNVLEPNDIKAGALLPGFVKSLQTNACYIHFLGGLFGVARIHVSSEAYVPYKLHFHIRTIPHLRIRIFQINTSLIYPSTSDLANP